MDGLPGKHVCLKSHRACDASQLLSKRDFLRQQLVQHQSRINLLSKQGRPIVWGGFDTPSHVSGIHRIHGTGIFTYMNG